VIRSDSSTCKKDTAYPRLSNDIKLIRIGSGPRLFTNWVPPTLIVIADKVGGTQFVSI